MSPLSTPGVPTATLDDDAWDDLLSYLEERRVIPIVGPELLQVATDGGPRLLYDWLAQKLAARLAVDVSQLPPGYTLNDVICLFQAARGRREEAYVRVRSILKEAQFLPAEHGECTPAGRNALKAAIEAAIALILEEHQDWHMLVRPHQLPLA